MAKTTHTTVFNEADANKIASEERAKNTKALVTIKKGYRNFGGGFCIPAYKVITRTF